MENLTNQVNFLKNGFEKYKKESPDKYEKNISKIMDLENAKKKLENIVLKMGQTTQTMHMLTKPQNYYDESHKTALGYQNPLCLHQAQWLQPVLYNGKVLIDKHNPVSVCDTEETLILAEERTKLYSVTLFPKLESIPKVVKKNDLSKTVTSHLTTNKIIEKCTKVLALGLLKIESKPINAYFKNNKVVHLDYLRVTKEHVATLQELLDQARALKPLDEHIGFASKFVARIQELLVYVSASCPFTQKGNEKWAPATSHRKNNKPYVDASRSKQTVVNDTKKHALKENTQKTDNTMLHSTGRVSSPDASGSKSRSNTKNDRIPQPSRRSKKNKVEAHHKKFKSSANKNNHVLDCNANVKNISLSKNSANAKSVKQKENKQWEPTGRIFTSIGLRWKPTRRMFNMEEKIIQPSPATIVPIGNRFHINRTHALASNEETRMRYSIARNSLIRAYINSYGYQFNPPNWTYVRNSKILKCASWNFRYLGVT
ncbi:hypothetical protein Tco_0360376 [Tanacetum coccineum]